MIELRAYYTVEERKERGKVYEKHSVTEYKKDGDTIVATKGDNCTCFFSIDNYQKITVRE